jgi:ankyrin repeat protein
MSENNDKTIFEYMDRFSLGNNELQDYIKSHPYDLKLSENDISTYAYAAMISQDCLKIIHETYLNFSDEVKSRLGKPWDIQGKETGYSAIHYVAESNITSCLKYLINVVGVDVDIQDKRGDTPLHIICSRGFIEAAQILLHSSSANINIVNNLGYTAFALCVKNNHYKMVSILLRYPVLFDYNWKGRNYDIRNTVIQSGSIEMKSVFQKHFKIKRHKNQSISRKKQSSKQYFDIYGQYDFYCSSLQDSTGYKGLLALAKHLEIKFKIDDYKNKQSLKTELCEQIAKQMSKMQLVRRLNKL